ncbi:MULTISPECIES: DUF4389 domain-containing protein [unclassified Nocardioides]|uniref:DUF4389 domain-containing protein n=1 Tax=unclassified Nocardioides TaxID=2615069 RepID=UPI0007032884|nr:MULTISPECIES: DUF4389 domain-containing protein [unclassified Nocardioides]KQZ70361.1 hypothetical protein ASD66_12080 [Nocardioides sp. Root151]KRF18221.1 hypothetical protein ASH02_01215 [Nocardioides sp. Soil796]
MDSPAYPVRVDATLQAQLSRWLWLVKWILVLPHYVVLAFLWLAFLVLTVVALVAIVVTGRYPRPIFDFNVGVLRWTWRVAYFSYGALGTDQYPPFSLAERADYPARLEVVHPEHLSRGLALVKWWLLAIPHYLVLGLLIGGGGYAASGAEDRAGGWGLVPLLVLVAGVVLLVTGRYPRGIFDLVIGLNRWALRVAAYATLMTDRYPPFRLDQGGDDPAGRGGHGGADLPDDSNAAGEDTVAPPKVPSRQAWGVGRIVAVIVASVALIGALGLLSGGVTLKVFDEVARDGDGYITSSAVDLRTQGHALVSEEAEIRNDTTIVDLPKKVIGTVRIEARAPDGEVFIGIAQRDDVAGYLSGVAHSVVRDPLDEYGDPDYRFTAGGAPGIPPGDSQIWAASAVGSGTQRITFTPREGSWSVVVMNADGTAPLQASVRVGATLPVLDKLASGLLWAGLAFLCGGGVGLWLAARRR